MNFREVDDLEDLGTSVNHDSHCTHLESLSSVMVRSGSRAAESIIE
jgi:hypothetical protein